MEYLIAAVLLVGFGYFIYTRVKKAKANKGNGGDGFEKERPPTDER